MPDYFLYLLSLPPLPSHPTSHSQWGGGMFMNLGSGGGHAFAHGLKAVSSGAALLAYGPRCKIQPLLSLRDPSAGSRWGWAARCVRSGQPGSCRATSFSPAAFQCRRLPSGLPADSALLSTCRLPRAGPAARQLFPPFARASWRWLCRAQCSLKMPHYGINCSVAFTGPPSVL